jgi:hypothetical protein
MAKLTADQIIIAKAWLHDIFVAGGIYPNPKRAVAIDEYANMYGTHHWNKRRLPEICNKAKILCDAIKNRKVDVQLFKNYDEVLEFFSGQHFSTSLDDKYGNTTARKPASMLARYISWFCSNFDKFVWYDGNTSTYEREEIQKTTLGRALFKDSCFESQHTPAVTKATTTSTTTTRAPSTGTPGQPQNNFKSRGPLSGVAVDLISTPNQKEHPSGPLFSINGFDSNSNLLEDTMYIRPVEADPKSQIKYMVTGVNGETNKVLFGKAKGYGYCQIYFDNYADADACLKKALANGIKMQPNVSIIKVCQLNKVLPNGYFKIGTEYGAAYISASKLNECLTEEADQEQPTTLTNKEKWERYEEAFFHEM